MMTVSTTERLAAAAMSSQSRLVFLVTGVSVLMTNLDLWVVNVALDSIGRDLPGSSLAGLSWIISAYAVTLAALLIIAGRLGDRSGYKAVFLIGTILFTLASIGCAIAPNLPVLIGMRVVQAAGAAMQLPSSLALLLASVPADRRHNAARLWSTIGAVAAAGGPVLGGLLIEASWRWLFLINVPIGVVVVLLGVRVLPATGGGRREPLPDVAGSVLLTIGVAALTGGIVQGPVWGWTSPAVLGLMIVTVLALSGFLRRCLTHPVPLIEPALWRVRAFTVANVGSFLFSVSFAIQLLATVFWCQNIWGYSALKTGLAMAPGPALVPFVAIASSRAVRRFGAGAVITVGCVVFAAGQLWRILEADLAPNYLWDLLPSMLLGGTGVGLALSTLIASGSTALPGGRSATGAAVINTGRQIASVVGVAVLVAVLGSSGIGPDSVADFHLAWGLAMVLVLGAGLVSLFLPRDLALSPRSARRETAGTRLSAPAEYE